jgi:amino acid transporter
VPLLFQPARRKMRFLPLIAATYFMVSGGPYGIEDILGGAGFAKAIVILLVLPFLWCLPTALMIGELASAIPAEGGFYVWVRRALGPFWGYQEGWLSLSASIFDMAIYPAIFVLYLGKFSPALTDGWRGYAWSLAVVALCCVWNLRGAPAVGEDSVWMFVLAAGSVCCVHCARLLAILCASSLRCNGRGPASEEALSTAILVAMWNYMGWDNASTVAQEVKNPQRNYPRAMIAATALVAVTYILPLAAMAVAGAECHRAVFRRAIGPRRRVQHRRPDLVGIAVVAGGAITGIGMFNALVMSYTRLPMAMAEEGMLPRVVAKRRTAAAFPG